MSLSSCRCSTIFRSKKQRVASKNLTDMTNSTISFKSIKISQAGSKLGTRLPINNGNKRSNAQFSCPFPPIVFFEKLARGNYLGFVHSV